MRISRRQMVKALAALPLVGTAIAAASGDNGRLYMELPKGVVLHVAGHGAAFTAFLRVMQGHASPAYHWSLEGDRCHWPLKYPDWIYHTTIMGGPVLLQGDGIALRDRKGGWLNIPATTLALGGVDQVQWWAESTGDVLKSIWVGQERAEWLARMTEQTKAASHLYLIKNHNAKTLMSLRGV